MGAAAEISRSRNQPNSFDREIEKATIRAGAAFSVESEGAIGINLPPIARVAAEFKVISAGELPNTQLNRQQLKCLIRYKLAAVSDMELKKEMYLVSTFGPANCQTLKIYREAASAVSNSQPLPRLPISISASRKCSHNNIFSDRERPNRRREQTSTVDRDRLFERAANFPDQKAGRDAASEN